MTKQTNRIQSLAATAAGLFLTLSAAAQVPIPPPAVTLSGLSDFGEYGEPLAPGERTMSVKVNIDGAGRGDLEVILQYAGSAADLAANPSKARHPAEPPSPATSSGARRFCRTRCIRSRTF